jgi:hypothetical protein
MSAFWSNLHRLTQGQLFAHGHLSPRTAVALANRGESICSDCGGGGTPKRSKVVIWPRLAIPH